MATYVLVHGAWSGAHGFHLVRGPLHAAGHAVFTPSLTGLGERAHLTSPQVGLTTHIQDVVNLVLYEDLDDIVLLGFSYGGMVVTGCLEHADPGRNSDAFAADAVYRRGDYYWDVHLHCDTDSSCLVMRGCDLV